MRWLTFGSAALLGLVACATPEDKHASAFDSLNACPDAPFVAVFRATDTTDDHEQGYGYDVYGVDKLGQPDALATDARALSADISADGKSVIAALTSKIAGLSAPKDIISLDTTTNAVTVQGAIEGATFAATPDATEIAVVHAPSGTSPTEVTRVELPQNGSSTPGMSPAPIPPLRPEQWISSASWSPDGSRIVYLVQQVEPTTATEVHLVDLATGADALVYQTSEPGFVSDTAWDPSSERLLLVEFPDSRLDLAQRSVTTEVSLIDGTTTMPIPMADEVEYAAADGNTVIGIGPSPEDKTTAVAQQWIRNSDGIFELDATTRLGLVYAADLSIPTCALV